MRTTKRCMHLLLLFFLLLNKLFAQLTVNGSAVDNGNACYELTQAQVFQNGTVWSPNRVSLNNSFVVYANLYFGEDPNGADGITFTLQAVNNNVGVAGGGIGVGEVEPSLIVEFDTYQNIDFADPNFDHIAIARDGNLNHTAPNTLVNPIRIDPNQDNVKNGNWYPVSFIWDAPSKTFTVSVNCEERIVYQSDLVASIFDNDPEVFWGFSSATGGQTNQHQVCVEATDFFEIDDLESCAGVPVQLELPASANIIQWEPQDGIDDLNSLNPTFTLNDTTTYEVTCQVSQRCC